MERRFLSLPRADLLPLKCCMPKSPDAARASLEEDDRMKVGILSDNEDEDKSGNYE